jgi:hypothetical protein
MTTLQPYIEGFVQTIAAVVSLGTSGLSSQKFESHTFLIQSAGYRNIFPKGETNLGLPRKCGETGTHDDTTSLQWLILSYCCC